MAFQGWLNRLLARAGARPPPGPRRAEAARESAEAATGIGADPGEARILIADDHAVNRLVLRTMLRVFGFRADEAADGKEALEACKARPYDLILMDCHMPNVDGIECARLIRALGGIRPVIVGITAEASADTRNVCLKAGMDRVIQKPVEENDLREILSPWKAPKKAAGPGPRKDPDPSLWVDQARLIRLVENTRLRDQGYRVQAFAQFRTDAVFLRSILREAGSSGKAGELKAAAHGLQGLCLTMGLNRLAETCRRLEAASLSGAAPDWSPVLGDLETAFEPSLAALGRALGIAPGSPDDR